MDRLPREAALCGCIIITNRTGAAAFDEDIPIPGRYRISGGDSEKTKFDVDKVFDLLQGAINDYDTLCHNFDTYRSWIGGQKMSMLKCVSRILDVISSS